MSKGDFARHINVSPSRVSQYISEGILDEGALDGKGRSARIRVDIAQAQIASRRNVGQSLGNGLKTSIAGDGELPFTAPLEGSGPKNINTAELIQLQRLEQLRRQSRREEIEQAQLEGRLVPADELARQVRRTTNEVIQFYTGMAPDIAAEISAQFPGVSARDVQHLIVKVMAFKRASWSKQLAEATAAMPETQEAVLAS